MRNRQPASSRRWALADGITWYDVLGVSAAESADTLRYAYAERTQQLRPDLLSGAPSPAVSVAERATSPVARHAP